MYRLITVVAVLSVVSLLAGCAGGNLTAPATPETPHIEARSIAPDGSISLTGAETWTVIGDTFDRPVELVPVRPDTIGLVRLMPGKWRAEALMSFADDIKIVVGGVELGRVHVITYHVRFDLMEVSIVGARQMGDVYSNTFDGGFVGIGESKSYTLSWVDHGNVGWPGWSPTPDVPVIWEVPDGLNIEILGDKGRIARVTGVKSGAYHLKADMAGKVCIINFIVLKG